MTRNIIIAVAPTGGWGKGRGNPVAPDAVALDVIRCAEAGAAVVHLHARDLDGRLTADMDCFDRTVERIRAACGILVEASTGGLSDLSAAQRALPIRNPYADMASLNMGSLNFGDEVYGNALPDIRFWIGQMAAARVKPSLEIFDTGHMETALHLIDAGLISKPCNFSFIFDVPWGMAYHPLLLDLLASKVPPGSRWGALFIGHPQGAPLQGHGAGFGHPVGAGLVPAQPCAWPGSCRKGTHKGRPYKGMGRGSGIL